MSSHHEPLISADNHYDIVIVGGGMVGLATLAVLKHQLPNAKVMLVESFPVKQNQQYQPSFDSRSTAISSGSVDVLARVGLWSSIKQHVTEIQKVHVSDKGHFGRTSYSNADNGGQALGFVVENAWLGNQLVAHAKGLADVQIQSPAVVERIIPKRSGAVLTICNADKSENNQSEKDSAIASGFQIYADLVVVADGAESALRKSLGMVAERESYGQHAIVANVEYERPNRGAAFERFTADGPMALLPLGESPESCQSALVWVTNDDQLEQRTAFGDDEFLSLLQASFGYRLGKLLRVSKRHVYPLERVIAQEQVRSSIVVMGNAAHYLHPVAGQGFNLALRDIARLGEALREGQERQLRYGELSVLKSYLAKQASDQWLTASLSHGFIKVFGEQNRAIQLLRNMGLGAVQTIPPLKHTFFSQMMGRGAPKAELI